MTLAENKQKILQQDVLDMNMLFAQLMVNKALVIVVTLLCFFWGALYAYKQVPVYESEILLQVDVNQSSLSQSGLGGSFSFAGSMSNNSVATQMTLIKSRFILDEVIKNLDLDTHISWETPSIWHSLLKHGEKHKAKINIRFFIVPQKQLNQKFMLVQNQRDHFILLDSKGRFVLQGNINQMVTNEKNTIKIFVQSIHAPLGFEFVLTKLSRSVAAHAIMSGLKIEETGSRMNQNTGILTIKMVGRNPKQLIKILNAIAKITKRQDAKKKSEEASQTLNFLYQQLPITKGALEHAEDLLNRYRAKSGKIDIKLQTQYSISQLSILDQKISKLHLKKSDMLQKYTVEHPAFIALEKQTKALEKQRHQLEIYLKTLPASDQIAVNLLRDVNVKKSLYVVLLNKIQELQVVKAGTISAIHILSEATMPDYCLPNKNIQIYLGSLLSGFVLSVIIIISRRSLSPRVEDPTWSERQYNLPNLAIIPFCQEQGLNALKCDHSKQIPLLAHTNSKNLTIESLRSLRTSLQVTLTCATNNIVSILGVSPGVGKSFISVNLAYLLASGGKRVLLIDADLRRGTLHKYMNIPPSPGLADFLNGTVPIETVLKTSVNENLVCLPRGVYPSDPSELLMSERFTSIIELLAKQFDVVILDTAPVLLVTDAVVVSGISATNYIVFGAGVHQPTEIDMVFKRLTSAGVKLDGSIFNFHRAKSNMQIYGQYYTSRYQDNYYYDDDESTKVKR